MENDIWKIPWSDDPVAEQRPELSSDPVGAQKPGSGLGFSIFEGAKLTVLFGESLNYTVPFPTNISTLTNYLR
jgi:hypothetical protein